MNDKPTEADVATRDRVMQDVDVKRVEDGIGTIAGALHRIAQRDPIKASQLLIGAANLFSDAARDFRRGNADRLAKELRMPIGHRKPERMKHLRDDIEALVRTYDDVEFVWPDGQGLTFDAGDLRFRVSVNAEPLNWTHPLERKKT